MLQQAGVTGLWRGCWPNVWRAALVNLGDLSTYDSVKRGILDNTSMEDNTVTHTMSSACAGLVGAIMGTPADVVKARIMNQPTDGSGRGTQYKSSLDCLIVTVKGEGFFGKKSEIKVKASSNVSSLQRFTKASCPVGCAWRPGPSHSGFHMNKSVRLVGSRPGDRRAAFK